MKHPDRYIHFLYSMDFTASNFCCVDVPPLYSPYVIVALSCPTAFNGLTEKVIYTAIKNLEVTDGMD